MKTFEFTVYLRGTGEDEWDAWEDAVNAFAEDPGECWDWHPVVLVEEDND